MWNLSFESSLAQYFLSSSLCDLGIKKCTDTRREYTFTSKLKAAGEPLVPVNTSQATMNELLERAVTQSTTRRRLPRSSRSLLRCLSFGLLGLSPLVFSVFYVESVLISLPVLVLYTLSVSLFFILSLHIILHMLLSLCLHWIFSSFPSILSRSFSLSFFIFFVRLLPCNLSSLLP